MPRSMADWAVLLGGSARGADQLVDREITIGMPV